MEARTHESAGRAARTYALKVRFHECDMYGHVNHAVYLQYLESARVELLVRIGLPIAELSSRGLYLVIRRVDISYRTPAFLGDHLEGAGRVEPRQWVGLEEVRLAGGPAARRG